MEIITNVSEAYAWMAVLSSLTIADLLWHQAIEADPDPRASPAPPGALHEPGTSALEADSERFGVS